jgi:hypothetical protein
MTAVTIIRIGRPQVRNAIDSTTAQRLHRQFALTSTLSRLSWGDVGVDALDALSCPVNEPPVRVAQR